MRFTLGELLPPSAAWVGLFALALPASAANYYVATTGSDSNRGTIDRPFRTFHQGTWTAQAGDTIFVRGGVYQEKGIYFGHFSGTADAPITLAAYPGENPIIDGDNYTIPDNQPASGTDKATGNDFTRAGLVTIGGSYLVMSGFEIRNSRGLGIDLKGSHNEVANCFVHGTRQQGILANGATSATITNCIVTEAGNYAPYDQGNAGGWPAALGSINGASYVVIQGCTVFHNWAEGIGPYSSSHVFVQDCVSYDNMYANIYVCDASFVTVQRNLVYGTNDPNWRRSGYPCPGILLGDETSLVGTDNTIINNVVAGGSRNISWWNGYAGSGLKNTLIACNTLIDSFRPGYGSLDIATGSHANTRITNNIVQQSNLSRPVVTAPQSTGLTFDHNLWSRAVTGIAASPSDVIGDPLLAQTGSTAAGQWQANWFALLPTSPARGAGAALAGVAEDFFRGARGQPPDLGAVSFRLPASGLINLAVRGVVSSGGNALILGFTLGGTAHRTVLCRAAGPSLAALGVSSPLADPRIEVYAGSAKIAENDNHPASLSGVSASVGAFAFAPGGKDAAVLLTLPPGGYTLQVTGVGGASGETLAEVYELP